MQSVVRRTVAGTRRWLTSNAAEKQDVFIWGKGEGGVLGLSDNCQNKMVPTLLKCPDSSASIADISCGASHTALATSSGEVFTFGKGEYGQLGNGETTKQTDEPQKVGLLGEEKCVQVSCGYFHTMGLTESGEVFTWGWGGEKAWFGFGHAGGLGHGSNDDELLPRHVEALADEKIVQIAAGKSHSLALTDDGKVYAWGKGENSRLGNNSSKSQTSPILVDYFQLQDLRVRRIFAGAQFSAALTDEGHLYMWGKNEQNQLGQGGNLTMDVYSQEEYPARVTLGGLESEEVTHVALSDKHTMCSTASGNAYYWGARQIIEPQRVLGEHQEFENTKIKCVGAGGSGRSHFSGLVLGNGELHTWGHGGLRTLGSGTSDNMRYPTRVETLVGRTVTDVRFGGSHAAAIVS